jgi:hypothetical protein
MTSAGKAIGTAANSGLRLVVVGPGQTRGRRAHLLRLRESVIADLKSVADGQIYLLLEVAVQRLVADLRSRPPGIEVIQVAELEPTTTDEHLIAQRKAKRAKATAATKTAPTVKSVAAKKAATRAKPLTLQEKFLEVAKGKRPANKKLIQAVATEAKKRTVAKKAA